jgi:hypothetical protein
MWILAIYYAYTKLFIHVCRALSLGDGKSPKTSVPSVHINDWLNSRNDLPIRSRSSLSASFLNKLFYNKIFQN